MDNQTELFNTRAYQNTGSGFSTSYDPTWDYTEQELEPPNLVLEQVTSDTNKSAPEQHTHWIEEYSPSNRKHLNYYRYCYMVGRKIKHVHIPGGNVNTPLVIYRKLDIEDLIAIGESPDNIVQAIKKYFKD